MNTNGLAFGLLANSGGGITVSRTFGSPGPPTGDAVLQIGQTFRFQLQGNPVTTGGNFGLTLRNSQSTGSTFRFFYTGGSPNYTCSVTDIQSGQFPYNYVTRTVDTGVPFNGNGVTVGFTENSNAFSLASTPIGGSTTTLLDTYFGRG